MSEVGNAKNIANFETRIDFATQPGSADKPALAEFQPAGLKALLGAARAALDEVNHKQTATNQREQAFAGLSNLTTRVANALAFSGADELTLNDARTINSKIQGRRAKALPKPDPHAPAAAEPVKTASVSQMSFDSRVENFARLVTLVAAQTMYTPNERALQTATLSETLNDLRAKNTAVINAANQLSNARLARNQTFHHDANGLVATAQNIKLYLKSVFGTNSPQYKQISGLKFTKQTV